MGKRSRLGKVLDILTIPVPEVSGIAFGGGLIYAVSDRFEGVLWARASTDGVPGDWQSVPASQIEGWRSGQLEAVSVLPDGRVMLLSEHPAHGMLIDPETWTVQQQADLVVPDNHELAKAWRKDPNSLGEGMVALDPRRVLVAKEKGPAVLVEFVLQGVALVADRTWPAPAGFGDISDLALAPDGSLAILSDESHCITLAALPARGQKLAAGAPMKLPSEVSAKAEGLAWLSDSMLAVASDTRKAKRNLVLIGWQ